MIPTSLQPNVTEPGFQIIVAVLLVTVMPDSTAGRIAALLLLVFFRLIDTGRFKLEWIGTCIVWIGTGSRHAFRWLRCKIRDKHYWEAPLYFSTSAPAPRYRTCCLCRKREPRE